MPFRRLTSTANASAPDAGPPTHAALRRRAIASLARRELSRPELADRLGRAGGDDETIAAVLDELATEGLLSDRRVAESVSRLRGARFGSSRVENELRTRGVGAAGNDLLAELRTTDRERASALWERKFGTPAGDAAERARQMRFLQSRGFPADVIRRVVPPIRTAGES